MSLKINAWRRNMPLGLEECSFRLCDPSRVRLLSPRILTFRVAHESVSSITRSTSSRGMVSLLSVNNCSFLGLPFAPLVGVTRTNREFGFSCAATLATIFWGIWQETLVWVKFTSHPFIIPSGMWKCRRIHRKRQMCIVWPIPVRRKFTFQCFFCQGPPSSH